MASIKKLQDAVATCHAAMIEARLPFLAGMLPTVRSGDDLPFALERLDTIQSLLKLRPPQNKTVVKTFKDTQAAFEQVLRESDDPRHR